MRSFPFFTVFSLYLSCLWWAVSSNGQWQKFTGIGDSSRKISKIYQDNTLRYEPSTTGEIESVFTEYSYKYLGQDDSGCIDQNVTFYRHFDQVVREVTMYTRKERTSDKCACTSHTFIFCNCSSLNLKEVPQNLIPGAEGIDLSGNFIQSLDGGKLQRYLKLKYLSLQDNNIQILSVESFKGLHQLQALDLRQNNLTMTPGTYPVGVFKDLSSLIALRINKNINTVYQTDMSYPDEALGDLKALKFLSMDGINTTMFGRGFRDLTNLETLSLSGYRDGFCKMFSLTNMTFENLKQLKMLNLSDCSLEKEDLDTNSFRSLGNLHTLDLSWNQGISLEKTAEILGILAHSGMKELYIRTVEWRFTPGVRIQRKHVENLPRNLTCIVATGNSINDLDNDVLENLPSQLRYLDFSGNKLVFGGYLQYLYTLTSLQILKLNGKDFTFKIPQSYPHGARSNIHKDRPKQTMKKDQLTIRLPQNLRTIVMEYAGLWYFLTELNVNETNSLEELYLSFNFFPALYGPITGLNKLKVLAMSKCQIKIIKKEFFENFPSLDYLKLDGNVIGTSDSLYQHPFSSLSNLIYLNLASNSITHFKSNTFRGLYNLRQLQIEYNKYYEFNVDISNMSSLQRLDMSGSSIRTLSQDTRQKMEALKNFHLLLSGTPLECDCSAKSISFINWLSRDKHGVVSKHDKFVCVMKNGASLSMDWNQFVALVHTLNRECADNQGLLAIAVVITILLLLVVVGSILYRFRWRLRYLYYVTHQWIMKEDWRKEENNFSFDVFISYSNDDLNFVVRKVCPELHSRGLKTYIHSRDFRAGDHVISNIIRAVKVSKKTLIILTNNFVSSKWCRSEFQMAKEEAIISGRKILVFLIADKIPKNKMGIELLDHIHKNTYIPYEGDVDNCLPVLDGEEELTCSSREMAMWDKLAKDIQQL